MPKLEHLSLGTGRNIVHSENTYIYVIYTYIFLFFNIDMKLKYVMPEKIMTSNQFSHNQKAKQAQTSSVWWPRCSSLVFCSIKGFRLGAKWLMQVVTQGRLELVKITQRSLMPQAARKNSPAASCQSARSSAKSASKGLADKDLRTSELHNLVTRFRSLTQPLPCFVPSCSVQSRVRLL